ncbi:hypothetical protein CVT27_05840 [Streptomyces cavourensis]|nr:hypothetical protein CVT27_05840 [Streptomyces cavourensis]
MIWGTVGVMGGLAYRGTVMCLLDNGTESATKRFTGSFAFSAACRRAVGLDSDGRRGSTAVAGKPPVRIRPHRCTLRTHLPQIVDTPGRSTVASLVMYATEPARCPVVRHG